MQRNALMQSERGDRGHDMIGASTANTADMYASGEGEDQTYWCPTRLIGQHEPTETPTSRFPSFNGPSLTPALIYLGMPHRATPRPPHASPRTRYQITQARQAHLQPEQSLGVAIPTAIVHQTPSKPEPHRFTPPLPHLQERSNKTYKAHVRRPKGNSTGNEERSSREHYPRPRLRITNAAED